MRGAQSDFISALPKTDVFLFVLIKTFEPQIFAFKATCQHCIIHTLRLQLGVRPCLDEKSEEKGADLEVPTYWSG